MTLIPDEGHTEVPAQVLAELEELNANNRILEAECVQMRELLAEYLQELGTSQAECSEAKAQLSKSERERKAAEARLAFTASERGVRRTSWAVSALRAEVAQNLKVLDRAQQSLHDLATVTASAFGIVTEDLSTMVPVLADIEAAKTSGETVLKRTSR